MKILKNLIALLLAFILLLSVFAASTLTSYAVTTLSDGIYKYAIISDESLVIYKYLGDETELILPESYGGRNIIGIYDDCFANSGIASVTIPDSYSFIGDSAFYNCVNLTEISIPKGITTIGMYAFSGCTKLNKFDIIHAENLRSIPEGCLSGDASLKSIYIPLIIGSIGDYAFANSGLTSINLPVSILNVGSGAFSGCTDLSKATLSPELSELKAETFFGCSKLTNIVLPESVRKIGDSVFEDCTSLAGFELTDSVTEIGEKAFYNDTALNSMFIPDTVTSIGADAFAPMSYSKTITVTCYENSYAAEYCYENRVENLVTIEKLLGDADLNGVVNILDVTCIQKYKIGEDTISTYRAKELADVNKDGAITIRDATLIQMYLAKIITEF